MLASRTFLAGACGVTLLFYGAASHSEPKPTKGKRCTATYKSAQEREHAGKLREAKQLFSTCAAACGGGLKKKCSTGAAYLESSIPSVVPRVTDDARTDVQVRMDGELLTSHLDGRALPVDPGMREFTFSTERGVVATQNIKIERGKRGQQISVALHASDSTAAAAAPKGIITKAEEENPALPGSSPDAPAPVAGESRARRGPPALAFVAGGVGLAGLGTGLLLTIWARNDNSDLRAS